MPHLVIEYSDNLIESISSMDLTAMNSLLTEIGPFKLSDIKSRAMRHTLFSVAGGGPNTAFVHLQLAMLPGRSPELKREVTQRLLEFLKQLFRESIAKLSCSLTVEIRELEKDSYAKFTSGTISPSENTADTLSESRRKR